MELEVQPSDDKTVGTWRTDFRHRTRRKAESSVRFVRQIDETVFRPERTQCKSDRPINLKVD